MIHPLLQLIAREPDLLGEHAGAYAELLATEIEKTSRSWQAWLALYAIALFLLAVGIVFTGVALMLWALAPLATMNLPWLLVLVPLAPLLAGSVCLSRARARPKYAGLAVVKEQLGADLAMLRTVTAS